MVTWDGPALAKQVTLPGDPAPAWLHVDPAADLGSHEPNLPRRVLEIWHDLSSWRLGVQGPRLVLRDAAGEDLRTLVLA